MLWWTLQQLKSKDASTRLKAVEKLADDVSPKVAEALIEAFGDPDDSVRKAAAKAIGATRDELYLQPLGRALRHRNEFVREAAADTLRQLHCAAAAPALVPLLADACAPVRWQAARALETLGWDPASGAEAARFDVARGKIEDASAHGVEAVEALASVLQSGAYHQRREAVAALSNIPDARVVKALLVALKDADDQVRSAAAESLCKIADPSSTDALILALNDAHKHVRAVAAEGLGHFGGPKAVEPLLRKLADKQWEVREAVCVALGRTRDARAFDPLVRALRDADREVREAAVRGLGLLGDKRAISPLLGALVDEQDSVRQLALSTLVTLDPRWDRRRR
jgi:HEAT repeat protein